MTWLKMINQKPKTIICDIDGTLIKHCGDITKQVDSKELLPGVLDFWKKIDRDGCRIILITGRRESLREKTIIVLNELGIFYDELIMGLPSGTRVLINDLKPSGDKPTALAINVERNKGLEGVEI